MSTDALRADTTLTLSKDAVMLLIAPQGSSDVAHGPLARIIRKHFQGEWRAPRVQLYFTEYESYEDLKKAEWLHGVIREYFMEIGKFGAKVPRPIKLNTKGMALTPWRLHGLVKVTAKQVHTEGYNDVSPPFVFNRETGRPIGPKAPDLTLDVAAFEDGERAFMVVRR